MQQIVFRAKMTIVMVFSVMMQNLFSAEVVGDGNLFTGTHSAISAFSGKQFMPQTEINYQEMYDGVCPSGLTRYEDYDCAIKDFTYAKPLSIKDTSDYAEVIYIDPTASGTEKGTVKYPYNSWSDITFRANYAYVQKAGTTYKSGSTIEIPPGLDHVYMGSYGAGAKPIIIFTGSDYPTIQIYGSNVMLRDLDLQGPDDVESAGIIVYARGGSDNAIVFNCVLRNSYQGFFTWSDNNKIINTEIYNLWDDGIWASEFSFMEISHCNIHDVNTAYYVNKDIAGGDGIQLEYKWKEAWIHHSIVDRSNSGNKFCILASSDRTWTAPYGLRAIYEFNTLFAPKIDTDSHGGAALNCDYGEKHLVQYNYFEGSPGTAGNGTGVWNEARFDSIIGNVFNNLDRGIVGASADDIVTSNNSFYSNDVAIYEAIVELKNNIFQVKSGESDLQNCKVIYETSNLFDGAPALSNSFSGSANFVDPQNGDFHILSTSNAIDKGVALPYFEYDKDGKTYNGKPDIGAFEHNGTEVNRILNNAPVIYNQEFLIKEDIFINNYIGKIIAYDVDADQEIRYSIASGNETGLFSVNPQSGHLSTTTPEVFNDNNNTYELTVRVTDNGQVERNSAATMKINFLAESSTIYINPENITDPQEDGSESHPFDTWQDVVWQDGHTYLQKKGTEAAVDKILISADNVTLGAYGDGDLPVIKSETNTYLISAYDRRNLNLNNLDLRCDNAVSCIYFLGSNSDNITIERCVLQNSAGAIHITDGKKFIIRYNTISSEREGISSTASITEIYYNIFKDNATAVNVMSNLSSAYIYNNVFYNNLESVSISYAELTLYNNIFYMTSAGQKAIRQDSKLIASDHNIFFPEQNGFAEISKVVYNKLEELQQELRIDLNSFTSDPKFVDIYTDNFAVEFKSPAIDAGIDLNMDQDYFGKSVPSAKLPDIGIAEVIGNPVLQMVAAPLPVLNVYPNPSTGQFNLTVETTPETMSEAFSDVTEEGTRQSVIHIVDMAGKTIFTRFLEHSELFMQESIDVTGVANGLYFVVLRMADKIVTEKLILNR